MEAEKKAGRPKGSKNKQRAFNFEYTDKHGHKYSKSELIRKFATTFPNAKPKDIATRYRLTPKFVSQVLWAWRKKNAGIVPVKFVHEVTKAEVTSHVKEQHEVITDRTEFIMPDPVNHPAHYTTGGIETIDFIEAKCLSYNLGNVVKYITRADYKGNKVEDLMKARWYLDREITNLTPPLP
jgi:hypothetical protein